MGETPEKHYENAQELLAMSEVLLQTDDIADAYVQAAKEMRAAGDYKDAPKLSKEYADRAVQVRREGQEELYQRACEKMNLATKTAQRKLAADMFLRISGYKDADDLAERCICDDDAKKRKGTLHIWIGILVAVAAVFTVSAVKGSSAWKYRSAQKLFEQERYGTAKKVYQELEEYKDSTDKALLCEEKEAEQKKAKELETLRSAEEGKEINFGKYSWVILKKDETSAMLVTTHSDKMEELSGAKFHDKTENVTWEKSSLREWLNGEFLENGFNEEERERILLTDVINEDNPLYHTEGGNDTQDYVYLLSDEETKEFAEGIEKFSLNWLLRTPGNAPDTVCYVTNEHRVMEYGCPVDWDGFFIRPVINVSLN